MAMASVSCASLLIEPKLMAPVVKRLTISLAGSTSSIGIGCLGVLELEQAAQRAEIAVLIVDAGRCTPGTWRDCSERTACCTLLMVSGFSR